MNDNKSETRTSASVLKQNPDTRKVKKNGYLIRHNIFVVSNKTTFKQQLNGEKPKPTTTTATTKTKQTNKQINNYCCLIVADKGAYPENSIVVLCHIEQWFI